MGRYEFSTNNIMNFNVSNLVQFQKKVPRTRLSFMTLKQNDGYRKKIPYLTAAAVFHKSSVTHFRRYQCLCVAKNIVFETLNLKRKTFTCIMLQCYLHCIRAGNGHSCAIHVHVYMDNEHCKLTLQSDFS